jgi:hypothetical protein
MTRIRSIKPQLFRHAELFDAEHATQLPLRLAFIGLILCCDKEGRFHWRPRELKLDVLPFDDRIDFAEVLNVLGQYGFVVQYSVNETTYGYIPSWHKHQVMNAREHRSLIPPYTPPPQEKTCNDISLAQTPENRPLNTTLDNTINEIFECWKTIMGHTKAQCDKNREKLIRNALAKGYTKEQLCMAIRGCHATPYNMGKNESGERYDSLKVIFRDADQIDRFLRHYHSPPKPSTGTQRRNEANYQVAKNWLNETPTPCTTVEEMEANNDSN